MKRGRLVYIISFLALISTVFSLGSSPWIPAGDEILYSQDFNSGSAPEWNLESGWTIASSEGGYALRGKGHVWARLTDGYWEDYFVRFRVKLESGAAVHANSRVTGASRYFIGIQAQNLYLSKTLIDNSMKENLRRAGGIGAGWHFVEISAIKSDIKVLVDKQLRMEYNDSDYLTGGGVAFESLADGIVWIDDVQVGVPAGPAAATTPATQSNQSLNLKWESTGGPLGGLGYDVRMRPDNPDVMFVTDAKAGVFRSLDGGKNWQAANTGITVRTGETANLIPIFCLTIDPHNPDIVWVGTQFQRGAFKSVDGGDTWTKMDNGIAEQSLTLRGFTVDPRSSDIVYAAGEVSSWEWNGTELPGEQFDLTKGVIYKTTNGGKSWKRIWSGDNLARYIWIDPRDSNVVYASTGIFDREAANSDPKTQTAGGVGVLKSTDGGKTWTQINQGLSNLYVGSLFMNPQNPDILLAGVGNITYTDKSGVYLSTDGGATWQQTLDEYVISAVEFSTSNPNIAYAGSINKVYRSEDGGKTWRQQSDPNNLWGPPGVLVGTPIDFQVDPRNPDRIFANAYGGGNFLSEDGGVNWIDASKGYTGAMIRDMVVDPRNPAKVYAVGRSGIFLSYDAGQNWLGIANRPHKDLDWHTIAYNPQNPDSLIADINCWRLLVYSSDGGNNWQQVNQSPERTGWRAISFAPSDPNVVYAGTTGVYSCGSFDFKLPAAGLQVSKDGGLTWAEANDENTRDASVSQLAVHPQDPQTVFAATFNRGLLKTSDGGKSWAAVTPNMFGGKSMISVQISPHNPDLMFAGRNQGGLARSEDGGVTWKITAGGINPQATVMDMAFDPTDPQIIYLADLFSGVYRSTDVGKSWKAINLDLLVRAVNTLALSADGQHLYAGTEGRGVFRMDLNGVIPPPISHPVFQPEATALPTLSPVPPLLPTEPPEIFPTPTSTSKSPFRNLPCGSMLTLPVALLGLLWLRNRKSERRGGR